MKYYLEPVVSDFIICKKITITGYSEIKDYLFNCNIYIIINLRITDKL